MQTVNMKYIYEVVYLYVAHKKKSRKGSSVVMGRPQNL